VNALKRQVKNMEKGQVIAFNFHKGFGFIKLLKSGDIVSVPIDEITGNKKYLINGEIVECEEIGGIGNQGMQQAKQVKRTIIKGQVKEYSSNNGFGWIQRFDNQPDISVHFTSIRDAGYKTLHEGDIVEFVEGLNTQGHLLNTQGQIALDVVVVSPALKIETFSLTGFKAFDTTVSLPIRPMTILAGPNSHGKSSIIHALLLLKQTLLAEKRVSGRLVLEWSGPFFKINEWVEIVHNKEEEKSFTLSFEIPSKLNKLSEHTKAILPAVRDNACYVGVAFIFTPVSQGRTTLVSLKVSLSVLTSSVLEEKNQTPLIKLEMDDLERKIKYQDQEFDCGKTLTFSYFLPIWEEKPPERLTIRNDQEFETAKTRFEVYSVYQDLFQPAIEVIQQELWHNLKYLGPLRSEPQREYIVGKLLHKDDIGKTGENAVVLLYQNWHEKINFVVLPKDRTQVISWHELSFQEIEIGEAINESLRWLGMQELKIVEKVEKVPGLLIQAIFPTSFSKKTWVTIADVGFGVSQILPVLTMGLLAEPDSILIFEQPEIHLHPRAQARLAELLVCLVYTGKRIIIETHSDHLINRMRRLVAEDSTNQLCDKVGIMFVQQDGKGAKIEALRVDKEGRIENWPPDFLAETAEDARAIVKARVMKRQSVNSSKSTLAILDMNDLN
jgi:predicted ATPase/cold shock CspA family protein